jgi:hypothetical protein
MQDVGLEPCEVEFTVSKGILSTDADDQDRIFYEGPPLIGTTAFACVLFSEAALAALAAYAARASGSGWITTALAAAAVFVVVSPVFGLIITWRLRHRPEPAFSLADFDVIRDAGNRALAAFRLLHPTVQHVLWALRERRDDGCVIRVFDLNNMLPAEEASCVYLVGSSDTQPRELKDDEVAGDREICGFVRSQCVSARHM